MYNTDPSLMTVDDVGHYVFYWAGAIDSYTDVFGTMEILTYIVTDPCAEDNYWIWPDETDTDTENVEY